jgi:hypothetical protein
MTAVDSLKRFSKYYFITDKADLHYISSLTRKENTGYNTYIGHVTDGSGFTTWSMTVDADRLGESTGQAGFCFI